MEGPIEQGSDLLKEDANSTVKVAGVRDELRMTDFAVVPECSD